MDQVRVADLPAGFVIAHRGGSLQAPENTLEAHRVAVAQGVLVVEQDVQVLADGALGVMHDGTVDRTTSSSGNVAEHTAASWGRLRIDAGTWLGGGWGDLRPPLFEQVLEEFGHRVLLCPEAKPPGTMAPLLDVLERAGTSPEAVLVQSFSRRECQEAVARGWQALWLGVTDPAGAAADGIAWIGVAASALTPALCQDARAAGVRVSAYTVDRQRPWERLRSWGVDACFSDDPAYLLAPAGRPSRDAFADQRWAPGMQADGDGSGRRGRFFPDGSFGFDEDSAPASSVLLGGLGPPGAGAGAGAGTVALDVRVRVEAGADAGRDGAALLLLSTTDEPPELADGYLFLLHRSGRLAVQQVRDGVATTLAEGATAAPAPGAYVPLTVTASPAGVSFGCTDGAGRVVVDGADGGGLGYLHVGQRDSAARFRDVVFR